MGDTLETVDEDICLIAEVTEMGTDAAPSATVDEEIVDEFPLVEKGREMSVEEIAGSHADPYFVNLTVLRQGLATGKPGPKTYTADAVRDAARLLPGVNCYLGHQKPGNQDWEYRTPQAKIVRGWTAKGPKGLVARAKAMVSRQSTDLRAHIDEGMAGPVSIDGRARLVREGGQTFAKEMLSLRCVDFCNPGTEGSSGAGVDEVVNEMDNESSAGSGQDNRRSEQNMGDKTRLDKAQLLAEYGAEVREMIREAEDAAKEPLAADVADLHVKVSEMESQISDRDKKIETLEADLKASGEKVQEMKSENEQLVRDGRLHELREFLGEKVRALETVDDVREMVRESVGVTVLEEDDDLTKSKKAIETGIEKEFGRIQRVAEIAGGTLKDKGGATAGGNPPRETRRKASDREAMLKSLRPKKAE